MKQIAVCPSRLTLAMLTFSIFESMAQAQAPYRIATVAGVPYDRSGNNGPATQAAISGFGAAFRDGYLYLADSFRIWRIDPSGTITTVVGVLTPNFPFTPIAGYAGDGAPALAAGLRGASSIEFDSSGNLYISDTGDACVRKVAARVVGGMPQPLDGSEIVTTFAGTCTQTSSILNSPLGLAFDPGVGVRNPALYIADPGNGNVRKVDMATALVSTVAAAFTHPTGVAVDPATGALYVADSGQILKVASGGTISSIAASPTVNTPSRLRFGNSGILYALDTGAGKVWQIANAGTQAQTITAVPGVSFQTGQEIDPDGAGGLFVTDSGAGKVYFVPGPGESGTILGQPVFGGQTVTVAGPSSVPTFTGDGGPATSARLLSPQGVAVDADGNLYISDTGNNHVRVVNAQTGVITTIAGTGTAGFAGVPGPATSAAITPGILQYRAGAGLFIASNNTHVVNDNSAGNLSIVNGTSAIPGARSIAFDATGNLYVGDTTNGSIWKVDQAGNATKLATGVAPGGGIAVDPYGNLYIAKASTHQIQKVTAAGAVSIYAGTGVAGGTGDGGPALQAKLQSPSGLVCDSIGNLYFADGSNHTIRKIDTSGVITTIGGTAGVGGYSGDGAPALNAQIQGGLLAFDSWGNLYLADVFPNVVRVLDNIPPTVTATATNADETPYLANTWTNQTVTVKFTCSDNGAGVQSCPDAQVFASTGITASAGGTATDRAGNTAGASFGPIRIDKTAPIISGMPGPGCSLWPPNGKMVQVATVTASDALSGLAPGSFTVTGTSNESSGGAQISIVPSAAGGYNIWLQADRLASGNGRVYTLTATAKDLAGNIATTTSTCVAPHDQAN